MIIRELVASLGIDFDKGSADRAKKGIDSVAQSMGWLQDKQGRWRQANGRFVTSSQFSEAGLKNMGAAAKNTAGQFDGLAGGLRSLVALAGGMAVARGFMGIVEAAANAEDYLNVNRETFGEHADGVTVWSKTTAEAMSRSEFEMRKMAGAFGSFLTPMLKDKGMSAEMSKTLSALSVDLASFYADMSDDEAMQKLFSGMAGETESVRRLGIDLTEAGLAEFARAEGITKSTKAMSMAEKTQLRFKKIMVDTKDKQGDAVRTADSYENRMRALKAAVIDFSTQAGGRFLDSIEGILGSLREGVLWLSELTRTSNIAEGAVAALTVVAGMFALSWALANIPIILAAAGIMALALVIDDLLVGMEGGESVIADFLGVDGFKEAIDWATKYAKVMKGIVTGDFDAVFDAVNPGGPEADRNAMARANKGLRNNETGMFKKAVSLTGNGYEQGTPAFGGMASALSPSKAFDMRDEVPRMRLPLSVGAGKPAAAQPAPAQNFVFHLNGPQSRESMDVVERSARKIGESTRVRG